MLIRFEVSNHRSILTPAVLSMVAIDKEREATRGFDLFSERVLTVAGIYGPNASGKSNVLEALNWLSNAVRTSLRSWEDYIPREPCRLDDGPELPSVFEIDFEVRGVRHEYHLEVDDFAVLYEGLFSYPERRRRRLFERHGEEIEFRRGLVRTKGTKELVTPTALALSAAIRVGDPTIRRAGFALAGIRPFGFKRRRPRQSFNPFYEHTMHLFNDDPGVEERYRRQPPVSRESALELLRLADPGIKDVRIIENDGNNPTSLRNRLRFTHMGSKGQAELVFEDESSGTQMWFNLLGPVLSSLRSGRTLLFDEIDASLHPLLSGQVIEMFKDPRTNLRGAQLIFVTHDSSLLGQLNRDEVWFTDKNYENVTELFPLAEFGGDRVRKSLNLERAYLDGRFGAIPNLDLNDIMLIFRDQLSKQKPTDIEENSELDDYLPYAETT